MSRVGLRLGHSRGHNVAHVHEPGRLIQSTASSWQWAVVSTPQRQPHGFLDLLVALGFWAAEHRHPASVVAQTAAIGVVVAPIARKPVLLVRGRFIAAPPLPVTLAIQTSTLAALLLDEPERDPRGDDDFPASSTPTVDSAMISS